MQCLNDVKELYLSKLNINIPVLFTEQFKQLTTIMKTKKAELSNKNKLVMNYFDKRAEVYGLRETKGVFLFQCSFDDDNEDEDDYTFRTAFFTHQDKNGNLYILPRQIDFEYDIEQYRDLFR
jgi:hypothetical protein